MNTISVFCPVTRRAVETGIETDWATFFSVRTLKLRVRCSQCGGEHEMSGRDGYLARAQTDEDCESGRLDDNPQIETLMARVASGGG